MGLNDCEQAHAPSPPTEGVATAQPSQKSIADSDPTRLRQRFDHWQQQQLALGKFILIDSCAGYRQRLTQMADAKSEDIYAFPRADEISYSYADLNQDGVLDGLMTFTPEQCDGSNGSMWSQQAVLLLSYGQGYQLNDTLNLEQLLSASARQAGFYLVDSIAPNRCYGHYYEFGPNSGHCCPSVIRAVAVDFARRQLVYQSRNQAELQAGE